MSLHILLLFMAMFIHDTLLMGPESAFQPWPADQLLLLAVLPKLILGAWFHLVAYVGVRRLTRPGGSRWLARVAKFGALAQGLLMASFVADLAAGSLIQLRTSMGDFVLLDEAVLVMPVLLVRVWMWWAYAPLDRRVREATLMSRLDQGLPAPPLISRRRFVVLQARHQLGLLLPPLALAWAWIESLVFLEPWLSRVTPGPAVVSGVLSLGGFAVIFALTPLVLRWTWDTVPLASGPLRDRLEAMCQHYRVKVRQLLVWRTYGSTINAAVVGLVPMLRYILLSDALLEQMSPRHVQAVMAHELAHVVRKHLPWMLGAAVVLKMTLLLVFQIAFSQGQAVMLQTGWLDAWHETLASPLWPAGVALILAVIGWLIGFGWISRRFEHQADAFAAKYLSSQGRSSDPPQAQYDRQAQGRPKAPAQTQAPDDPDTPDDSDAPDHHDAPDDHDAPGQTTYRTRRNGSEESEQPHALDDHQARENPDIDADAHTDANTDSRAQRKPEGDEADRIEPEAAQVMIDTLEQIAQLNHIPKQRFDWRHGSIARRQAHLRSIVNVSFADLPIDRRVRRIQWAAVLTPAVGATLWAVTWMIGLTL